MSNKYYVRTVIIEVKPGQTAATGREVGVMASEVKGVQTLEAAEAAYSVMGYVMTGVNEMLHRLKGQKII